MVSDNRRLASDKTTEGALHARLNALHLSGIRPVVFFRPEYPGINCMRGSKTRSSKIAQIKGLPFIVLNLPFVGIAPPAIKPSVGNKTPLIGFQRFLGFTLIELLITFVIAAILLGLAYPNLRVFVQNNRLRTEASELLATINQARTEAKANGGVATVCVSVNQTTCAAAGTGWDKGWLSKVWVDTDGDGTVDAGEERILRARPAPGNGIVLSSTEGTTLSFSASGAASGALNFRVCDSTRSGEEGRIITINATTGGARLSCLPGTDGKLCSVKPEQPIDDDHPACS